MWTGLTASTNPSQIVQHSHLHVDGSFEAFILGFKRGHCFPKMVRQWHWPKQRCQACAACSSWHRIEGAKPSTTSQTLPTHRSPHTMNSNIRCFSTWNIPSHFLSFKKKFIFAGNIGIGFRAEAATKARIKTKPFAIMIGKRSRADAGGIGITICWLRRSLYGFPRPKIGLGIAPLKVSPPGTERSQQHHPPHSALGKRFRLSSASPCS